MGVTRFRLDSSYRRPGDAAVVVAGSPLKLFRLSQGGVNVMRAIERGDEAPSGHEQLTDRLVDAGAIHPLPTASTFTLDDITIVVPAFGEGPVLPAGCRVIIVDDAGEPPAQCTDGHQVIRLDANSGPGAARNAGLAHVTTPLVAFIDTDVALDDLADTLAPLLAHFTDERMAVVAPRVSGATSCGTLLARYESLHSPLDLGSEPARVEAGTRVSYVPAATLLCRTTAVRAVNGFDASLRYGEDVDLVWRLAEAGWRCRYEPASVVHHRPRATWRAWAAQRMSYGGAAVPLARRHPGALAPLRISGWSAAVWALVVMRRPITALGVAAGTSVALQRKLTDLPPRESFRLAGLGHLFAGRQIASGITRTWWPLALVATLVSRRARWVMTAAAVVPPVIDWVTDNYASRRPTIDPARYVMVRLADDLAYGAGVWRAVIEQREAAPLIPSLRNWPPRAGS